MVPIAGTPGEFLIAHGRDISHIRWDNSVPGASSLALTPLVSVEGNAPTLTRFNDGKCDGKGRLWAGTMEMEDDTRPGEISKHMGALYRIDRTGVKKMLDKVIVNLICREKWLFPN